jgi:hypothetical protein
MSAYETGASIVGVVTFFGSWVYCIAHYGYLLGVGLGWLPSLIVAALAAAVWPLLAAVLMLLVLNGVLPR